MLVKASRTWSWSLNST